MKIRSSIFLSRMIGKRVKPQPGITYARGIESIVQPDEMGVVTDVRWDVDSSGTFPVITVEHEQAIIEYLDHEIVRA